MFLWKTAKGALPVGERLLSRHINIDPKCKRCGAIETIPHLIFHFEFAQLVWSEAPFATAIDSVAFVGFKDGWKAVRETRVFPPVGVGGEELAPWIVWHLWKARNNTVFNNKIYSTTETILKAIVDCKEWKEAQPLKKIPIRPSPLPNLRPVDGTITAISDAAWRIDKKIAGLGWSFSHRLNQVISNHSSISLFVNSPLVAEGLAMRASLEAASHIGFKDLEVESDSQVLISAINSGEKPSEVYGILSDIASLSKRFNNISFKFISRAFNVVADKLAKETLMSYVPNII